MAAVLLVFAVGGAVLLASGDGEPGEAGPGPSTPAAAEVGDEGEGEPAPVPGGPAGGDGSAVPGGDDPEGVVESYVAASGAGDCQAMVSLVTESMLAGMTREMAVDECETLGGGDPQTLQAYATLEVSNVDDQGDVATVDCRGEFDGSPLLMSFTVVRQGDTWLIDGIS
jgi:hypothetical protein